jgi:hypothetical protein
VWRDDVAALSGRAGERRVEVITQSPAKEDGHDKLVGVEEDGLDAEEAAERRGRHVVDSEGEAREQHARHPCDSQVERNLRTAVSRRPALDDER